MFKQYGIKVNMLERLNGAVSLDAINYVRFDDEGNSVFWLDKGSAEAVVSSSTDWDKKQHYADYYRSRFRVLQGSEDIPRAFEIALNKLPLFLVEKVKFIQLVMEKKAPDILKKYEGTTKFVLLAPYHKKWLRNAAVKVKDGLSEK